MPTKTPPVASWNSLSFHMLLMNLSMFMDPKLCPASHIEYCSSSNIGAKMEDCRAGATVCSSHSRTRGCEVTSSSEKFTSLLLMPSYLSSPRWSRSTYSCLWVLVCGPVLCRSP
uniref:Uncharacterized protein n=1 Tax=Triticum urartu TaxID=4572 RepID=A0A8R7PWT0_TRIUA